ncbi:MAG: hypothetical protein KatS3mg039_0810 [Candidatus Kapaibacterium sp.]|nr:MAG: hypothetical protein KatS3mg039_0810 [Candidatus Kapabacteria bacterium]
MVRIPINGLSNGEHPVAMDVPATEVEGIFPEFIGQVHIEGSLSKVGKKLLVSLTARCTAQLTCDYSLESFEEMIEAEFSLSFMQDTELFLRRPDQAQRIEDDPYSLRLLRDDDTFVDITSDIAQELSIRLPIKRVAPQYRAMTFAEYAKTVLGNAARVEDDDSHRGDGPWAVLNQLR